MIFGSTLLEVAIGVFFLFLLLSMLCSALNELIESFLRFRARDLEKGIGKLLNDPGLVKDFFAHPLIKSLGDAPSYIPARTFSLALWSLATTEAEKGKAAVAGVTQDLGEIRALLASMDGTKYGDVKTSLLVLIDEAGGDIGKARTNIEEWYDDAMDRVSGWYKRRTQWILIGIGLVAAVLLNIDTINVTRALWHNDTLRSSVLMAAEDYIKENPQAAAPSPASPTSTAADDAEQQAKLARQKIDAIRGEIDKLDLPIGWVFAPDKKDKKYTGHPELYDEDLRAYKVDPRRLPDGEESNTWFLKILGLFLTALAVSQGAPFWFDLLNKFIVVRSTVKPREKSPEQPSKDKPRKAEEKEDEDER